MSLLDLADRVHIGDKGFVESVSGKCTVKELRQGFKDKKKDRVPTFDELGIRRIKY